MILRALIADLRASADPWIASVVARFLPLATYYTSIHAFVEQYSVLEHGVINHALCAAIREMLRVRLRESPCPHRRS